jgi:methionine--tRNA ligase beta chain
LVSFNEWQQLDLRTAKIQKVENIEGKDKLYKIQIDLGTEQRQIVAGLKESYSAEELEGKNIVVVANLEKVNIAGIESQAMLLAAKNEEGKYRVVTIDESVKAGTKVE